MLITENLINITVTIRDIVEIWVMLYYANFLFLNERVNAWKLLFAVIVVAGIVVPFDCITVVPILPVLVLLIETIVLKAVSSKGIPDILGNMMFGIVITFIPELLFTWISMFAGISENSYAYYFMTLGSILVLVGIGIIINIADGFVGVKKHIEKKRELIVILSVSAMIPLVLLGKYYLWDSLMFWEGYEGTATLVAVYFVIGLYLIKTFVEFTKNRSDLEVAGAYNRYLSDVADELNKREHEYKNQLNVIIGIAESGKEDACNDIIAFAEEIIEKNKVRKKAGSVISDNAIVAAFVLKMSRDAEERKIRFDYHIERPFPSYGISNKDLLEVIVNLLNNAFEAVASADPENRNVSLCIEKNVIEVANFVGAEFDPDTIAKAFNTGYSTKDRNRGYGMANVLAIAEKNNIKIDSFIKGNYLDIRLEMQ